MRALRVLLRALSRSPAVAAALTGVPFPPLRPGERYFDLTTLALLRVVRDEVRTGMRLLDLGCGLFATIGRAAASRPGCRVVSADVDPAIVERARQAVSWSGAPVEEVVVSDLLGSVPGRFDAIAFNPPYVPSDRLLAEEAFPGQSDGGPDGTRVIARFLEQFAGAGEVSSLAYLGVNGGMVPADRLGELVAAHPSLARVGVWRRRPWPAEVHVVVRR